MKAGPLALLLTIGVLISSCQQTSDERVSIEAHIRGDVIAYAVTTTYDGVVDLGGGPQLTASRDGGTWTGAMGAAGLQTPRAAFVTSDQPFTGEIPLPEDLGLMYRVEVVAHVRVIDADIGVTSEVINPTARPSGTEPESS